MSDLAAVVAYNFYEHKDPKKLLAEGLTENVSVKLVEVKDTSQTYVIGDSWTAILFTPVGKKHAVTIRPILNR
jgi:hypothetical protein